MNGGKGLGLVPRLCLGTHCLAGSAGPMRGGASRATGYEAEPRNQSVQGVCDPPRLARRWIWSTILRACFLAFCGWLTAWPQEAAAADSAPPAAKPSTDEMLRDSLDNELLKGLDVPPATETVSPSAAKPRDTPTDGASDIDQSLLEQLAEGEDLGKASPDPLVSIGRRMRVAEELISRQVTSQKTQRVQQQVIEDLDRLIEEMKKQCQSGQGSSTSGPKPGAKPGRKSQAGSGENTGANQPAKESTARTDGNASDRENLLRLQQMLKQIWGHLPPKIRDQMQSSAIEEFLPRYEKLIEEYYTRLAEEGSTQRLGP